MPVSIPKMIFRLAESVILASLVKGLSITSFLFGAETTPLKLDTELLILTAIFFMIFLAIEKRSSSQEFDE
jgi:hypothetical protein